MLGESLGDQAMEYEGLKLERTSKELPRMAKPADWIAESRLILVLGNVARRYLVAGMFITPQMNRYLRLEECTRSSAEDLLLRSYLPGVYVELKKGARLSVGGGITFKPGVYELRQILGLCHKKDFRRQFGEDLCRLHAKILRAVSRFHRRLLPGLYEISEVGSIAQLADGQVSRPAGTLLSEEEKYRLQKSIDAWIQHSTRTGPIDPNEIIPAIKHLYSLLQLKEPQVVIVPSPLATAIAGSFAAAIWHARKAGQLGDTNVNAIAHSVAEHATLSSDINDSVVHTACCQVEDTMNDATRREISELISSSLSRARVDLFGYSYREPRDAADGAPAAVDNAVRKAIHAALADSYLDCAGRTSSNAIDKAPGLKASHAPFDIFSCGPSAKAPAKDAFRSMSTRLAEAFSGGEKALRDLMIAFSNYGFSMMNGRRITLGIDQLLEACKESAALPPALREQYQVWQKIQISGAEVLMHEAFCIVSDFPEFVRLDDGNRPHCEDGPSVSWRDGSALYDWHGVRVTRQIIEAPHTLSVSQILSERNVEVRRIMIQRYGLDRFITAVRARVVQKDKFGVLYRYESADDEPIAVVKVKNSTPEPDGTFKEYHLRVPPGTKTAKEGVSWTFGFREEEYGPAFQT